jgi:WD40 repeat protein
VKKILGGVVLLLLSSIVLAAQSGALPQQEAPKSFPDSDFTLSDRSVKPEKGKVVLGPNGTVSVYGGSSQIQVSSLSFSGDGKLLAVGSTPNRVDIWDVEKRIKLRSLQTGDTVALTLDGRLLATDGNGIELWDVSSGKLQKRIPRTLKRAENVINNFVFSPAGTLLDVTANGDDDTVYDVSSGKLLATLADTTHAQFSSDGSLLIGGNYKHIVVWNTKDWSKVRDLPNGPDYVTAIAVSSEKDLVVIGGPKVARLLRLSTGDELAKVGTGYTNFAAFGQDGALLYMYPSSGFGIWDNSGKQYCMKAHLGNGTIALSANNRWLASAPVGGLTSVTVWDVQSALRACGIRPALDGQ